MATDNKTSILVDSQLPEFLQDEGPKFQAFVRAYYEWLETTGQLTDRSKNLFNYGDIDRTDTEFLKYFQREILALFPEDILVDKRLLAKNINNLYRAKGTQQAFRLLFRLLYNEEIEFYYPSRDILIASDGRWVQETSIRVSAPFVGDMLLAGGEDIVGDASGATARVNRVTSSFESGIVVYELFLVNINGSFIDLETVTISRLGISGKILASVGPLQEVVIQFGGSNHRSGDRVAYTSASGSGANGIINITFDASVDPLIIDGGSGYATNATITVINPGAGSGAAFRVTSLSDTETIPIFRDKIGGLQNTFINANTFGTSNSATISANLFSSNSSTTLGSGLGTVNITVGTIAGMVATDRGSNYSEVPTVIARQEDIASQLLPDGEGGIKGDNANISAVLVEGAITTVTVDNPGASYNRSDTITISNLTRANTTPATGFGKVTGVINNPGKYTDTNGFLSWNNRLQDNFYYQQFSYVLKSTRSIETYRELIKSIAHPAGIKLFGELKLEANVAMPLSIVSYYQYIIEDVTTPALSSTLEFGPFRVGYSLDLGTGSSILSTLAFGDIEVDMNIGGYNLNSVNSTLAFGAHQLNFTIGDHSLVSTINLDNIVLGYTLTNAGAIDTTLAIGNIDIDMTLGGANLNSVDSTLIFGPLVAGKTVYNVTAASTLAFGAQQLNFIIDPETWIEEFVSPDDNVFNVDIGPAGDISSTAVVTADGELEMFVGRNGVISIQPTTVVSNTAIVFGVGAGTVTNFSANTIGDLSADQIADYDGLTIDSLPGNKIFDGIGTQFTTELTSGSLLYIRDVNNTDEEIVVTVSSIDDANTLAVTSNVVYSNNELAIINNGTFLFVY